MPIKKVSKKQKKFPVSDALVDAAVLHLATFKSQPVRECARILLEFAYAKLEEEMAKVEATSYISEKN